MLAVTTFTVVPVPARSAHRVDRGAARWAMICAPLVGVLVGIVGAAVLAVAWLIGLGAPAAAVAAVAALALFTRGLHLDGLADLADGLGSRRGPEGALEVMKRSDIGPFGVVTLVLTLLAQVAALAHAYTTGGGAYAACALVVAAVTGRLAVTWACRGGVAGARPEGLGALVAGTVPVWAAAIATVLVLAAAAVVGTALPAAPFPPVAHLPVAVAVGVAVAVAVERHAVRRLGGVTGDVLGALLELSTTATLLTLTAFPG